MSALLYRLLADLTRLLHLAFIAFAVFGGVLALRWRRVPWAHAPALVWAVLIELRGWICPLTPLENKLRRLGGEAGYGGGFIDRYLLPRIYPEDLTRDLQILLGLVLLVFNIAVYTVVLLRRRRGKSA